MEKKNVMSEEMALDELKKWAEDNELDIFSTDDKGRTIIDSAMLKLAKKMQEGSLSINENNEIEYIVSEHSPAGYAGEKLTFTSPDGSAFMATDKFKQEEGTHRVLAVASAMTGQDIRWFAKLNHVDYKIAILIASFFIGG